MANKQNLKPEAHKLTVEEQSKGGVASGKSRRRKKLLSETIEMLAALPLHEGKLDKLTSTDSIDPKKTNLTIEEAIILKQMNKAVKGNLPSAEWFISLIAANQPQQEANTEKKTTDNGNNAFIEALNKKAVEVWEDEDEDNSTP